MIESYGTGIRKIFALYADCTAQPRIEVTQHTFKMILPNKNAVPDRDVKEEPTTALTLQMKTILRYINERGYITDAAIEELLGLKRTRAYTIAKQMRDMGLLEVEGRGEKKRYYLKRNR